jgi:hypothetical protein
VVSLHCTTGILKLVIQKHNFYGATPTMVNKKTKLCFLTKGKLGKNAPIPPQI